MLRFRGWSICDRIGHFEWNRKQRRRCANQVLCMHQQSIIWCSRSKILHRRGFWGISGGDGTAVHGFVLYHVVPFVIHVTALFLSYVRDCDSSCFRNLSLHPAWLRLQGRCQDTCAPVHRVSLLYRGTLARGTSHLLVTGFAWLVVSFFGC